MGINQILKGYVNEECKKFYLRLSKNFDKAIFEKIEKEIKLIKEENNQHFELILEKGVNELIQKRVNKIVDEKIEAIVQQKSFNKGISKAFNDGKRKGKIALKVFK